MCYHLQRKRSCKLFCKYNIYQSMYRVNNKFVNAWKLLICCILPMCIVYSALIFVYPDIRVFCCMNGILLFDVDDIGMLFYNVI